MSTIPDWNTELNTNRLIKTYVNEFIDISGNLVIRENTNLHVTGNIDTKGNVSIADSTFSTDVNLNHRLYVGGDASINSNVTINGNNSLGGTITSCQIAAASIPVAAFNGSVPSPSPDYSQPTIIYENDVNVTADISMNGSTVQATNIKVDGNIQFSDGTILDSYSNHFKDISGNEFNTTIKPYLVNSDIPTTMLSNDVAPQMHVSADGRCVICCRWTNPGTGVTSANAGPTYSGAFFSTDYGNTFTRVVLPPTLLNNYSTAAILSTAMSNDGKYMMICTTGTSGGSSSWTNAVIGWSMDYGKTWSSEEVRPLLGQPNNHLSFGVQINNISINHDGSKAVMYVQTSDGTYGPGVNGVYVANNWSSSPYVWKKSVTPGSTQVMHRGSLVKNIYVVPNTVASQTLIYNIDTNTFLLGSSVSTSYQGRYSTGPLANEVYISNSGNNMLKRIANLHTAPVESDIILPGTPSVNYRYGVVVSNSGKYVIVGHNSAGSMWQPRMELFNTTYPPYFSNDYGATFIGPITLANPSSEAGAICNISLSDSGFMYVQFYSNNNKILRHDFSIFKASTFTNLSVINTLKVGANQYTSDYRIKNDVTPLDATITIDHLRPVKYLQTLIHKQQYGLIAHELQSYFPDLVKGEKDGEQLQSVNYTGLIAILVNEIKRLKRELTELENEIQ